MPMRSSALAGMVAEARIEPVTKRIFAINENFLAFMAWKRIKNVNA
jgi:hypothetical protein